MFADLLPTFTLNFKIRSHDLTTPNLELFFTHLLLGYLMCSLYEVSVFNHTQDIKGPKFQNGHMTPVTPVWR